MKQVIRKWGAERVSPGLGAASCDPVLWAGDESELWLPALLHPTAMGENNGRVTHGPHEVR